MTTQQQLVDKLRPLGVRLTPQRLAIAEVVVNSADHPSVRDIYDRVRAFFPYVTIATVYSTLNMLEELGIVRELPFQRQSRYDANTDRWHFLTGPEEDVKDVIKNGFKMGDYEDIIFHSEKFALIDQVGNIRGYYNGMKTEDVNNLKKDIIYLLKQG